MNAPDFNFGPERRERGLTVVGDRRDLVIGTYPTAGAAPAEPDGPNLRDQFFKYPRTGVKAPLAGSRLLRRRSGHRLFGHIHVDPDLSGNSDDPSRSRRRQSCEARYPG